MGSAHLHHLRAAEWQAASVGLDLVGARVLELGAGDGYTANLIAESAEIEALDLPMVAGAPGKLFDVKPYDGEHLPFEDGSFDFVFTNSVLEHVENPSALHGEMQRVLKPAGLGVHIVPTGTWRFWTDLAHYIALPREVMRRLSPRKHSVGGPQSVRSQSPWVWLRRLVLAGRHGEEGNAISEIWLFSLPAWRRRLASFGWSVVAERPVGIWYTGYEILAERLALEARRRIAALGGSSSIIFVTARKSGGPAD